MKRAIILAILSLALAGCSTGGGKASKRYPVREFVDPVTEVEPVL